MSSIHQLVKYKNRKIYSKTTKTYVNLDYIANLIKTKTPFVVYEKGDIEPKNITLEVKATAIGELLKSDEVLLAKVSNVINNPNNFSVNEVRNEQNTATPQA